MFVLWVAGGNVIGDSQRFPQKFKLLVSSSIFEIDTKLSFCLMKRIIVISSACALFLSLITSCKKEKNEVNTDEVRLTAIERQSSAGNNRIAIEYNSSGKITKLTSHPANQSPV